MGRLAPLQTLRVVFGAILGLRRLDLYLGITELVRERLGSSPFVLGIFELRPERLRRLPFTLSIHEFGKPLEPADFLCQRFSLGGARPNTFGGFLAMIGLLGFPPSAGIGIGSKGLRRGIVALSDFCPLVDLYSSFSGSVLTFATVMGTLFFVGHDDALGSAFTVSSTSSFSVLGACQQPGPLGVFLLATTDHSC